MNLVKTFKYHVFLTTLQLESLSEWLSFLFTMERKLKIPMSRDEMEIAARAHSLPINILESIHEARIVVKLMKNEINSQLRNSNRMES
jgi:hypothetical protein